MDWRVIECGPVSEVCDGERREREWRPPIVSDVKRQKIWRRGNGEREGGEKKTERQKISPRTQTQCPVTPEIGKKAKSMFKAQVKCFAR